MWGLWVPPPFRTVGSDKEWNRLAKHCRLEEKQTNKKIHHTIFFLKRYDAFDQIKNGRANANKDVLRWRSLLAGYLFQPLPQVLAVASKKVKK